MNSIAEIIGGTIPKKAIKPILSGVKIYAQDGKVLFEATDMESSVRIESKAYDIEGTGAYVLEGTDAYVIDAETLKEIAKKSITTQIEFELEDNKAIAHLGAGQIKIPVMNAEDYPLLSFAEQGDEILIPYKYFKDMTDKTVFCASTDEMVRNLNGVLWHFEGRIFRMVTADSYRMSIAQRHLDRGGQIDINLFLPLKAVKQMLKIVKDDIKIKYDSKAITFVQGNITFATRLLDVNFPNYKAVVPEQFETTIKVNRKELIDAVKLIEVIARGKGDTVKFDIQGGMLNVAARSQDRGDGDVKLMIEHSDKDILVAFDPNFLVEGLSKYDVEDIEMKFVDASNAMQTGDDKDIHIVMPVKIRS
jgi:DNA polymerase-3 subunit beta